MTIKNCEQCGGTHFGSSKCPFLGEESASAQNTEAQLSSTTQADAGGQRLNLKKRLLKLADRLTRMAHVYPTPSNCGCVCCGWSEDIKTALVALERVEQERDAMQRRAEAAESDWQITEELLASAREENTRLKDVVVRRIRVNAMAHSSPATRGALAGLAEWFDRHWVALAAIPQEGGEQK